MTNAVSLAQQASTGVSQGFKNRIINGAMVIDQRNAGASVTPTNPQYTLDRWVGISSQSSKYTVQQNAGSVTPPAGFINYLGVTSSSAYSVLSTDFFGIRQVVEGLNITDLGWGTANAKTVTLSFWVRSSLTGTFGAALGNDGFTRVYTAPYTINAANTWEYKTVTIPGDTSGTWLTTNGVGIYLTFSIGYGSSYLGAPNVWNAGSYFMPTGSVSVVGTNGATWYITGVQLEVGSTATSFDYRPYTTELQLCQRYFINWVGSATSVGYPVIGVGSIATSTLASIMMPTPVPLRTTPTISFSGSISLSDQSLASSITSINTTYLASSSNFWVVLTVASGGYTVGRGALLYCQNASTNSFSASAEL